MGHFHERSSGESVTELVVAASGIPDAYLHHEAIAGRDVRPSCDRDTGLGRPVRAGLLDEGGAAGGRNRHGGCRNDRHAAGEEGHRRHTCGHPTATGSLARPRSVPNWLSTFIPVVLIYVH